MVPKYISACYVCPLTKFCLGEMRKERRERIEKGSREKIEKVEKTIEENECLKEIKKQFHVNM